MELNPGLLSNNDETTEGSGLPKQSLTNSAVLMKGPWSAQMLKKVKFDSSAINDGLEREVRPLLDVVDKLRRHGIEKDIPIPQIAVFGDQSSGKSSVLESLSGIPFPRGIGLVTRCATQLTMKRNGHAGIWSGRATLSSDSDSGKPCAPATLIEKPGDVAKVISEFTTQLVASTSGFSDVSIVIECEGPNCPDLTIIDLPGIVRTTTAGQDQTVIETVNALLEKYLRKERTVILAVAPGT